MLNSKDQPAVKRFRLLYHRSLVLAVPGLFGLPLGLLHAQGLDARVA